MLFLLMSTIISSMPFLLISVIMSSTLFLLLNLLKRRWCFQSCSHCFSCYWFNLSKRLQSCPRCYQSEGIPKLHKLHGTTPFLLLTYHSSLPLLYTQNRYEWVLHIAEAGNFKKKENAHLHDFCSSIICEKGETIIQTFATWSSQPSHPAVEKHHW